MEIVIIRNWIRSVGVELEGGIIHSSIPLLKEKWDDGKLEIKTDGSVHVSPYPQVEDDWIDDVEITYWDYDPEKVKAFVRDVWQLGFRQNYTCGNHMHLSLIHI